MKMNLSMVYVIKSLLEVVKKEMDEKNLTFEEIIKHYDEAIEIMEKANTEEQE